MQSLQNEIALDHRAIIDLYISEGRTVSGAKGDSEAKKQMERDNALQKQAFDAQMKQLDQINKGFSSYLSGTQGFDPTQLALLKTQFRGQNANDFANSRSALTSMLASRGAGGGQTPVGGDYTRGLSGLFGAEAQSLAGGLNNIDLMNLQQALTNKFNAGSLLSGNAATLSSPISTFGSGAASALNSYVTAKNTGLMSSFLGGLGGGLGAGLTGGIGGGLASLGGSLFKTPITSGIPMSPVPGSGIGNIFAPPGAMG